MSGTLIVLPVSTWSRERRPSVREAFTSGREQHHAREPASHKPARLPFGNEVLITDRPATTRDITALNIPGIEQPSTRNNKRRT